MVEKLFRRGVSFASALMALGLAACVGSGSFHSHSSAVETDATGILEPKDDPGSEDPVSSLPGPFDTESGSPYHPPVADAEPSVFSTQIGEGHTPTRPFDECAVEIFLSLEGIAAEHDYPCNLFNLGSDALSPRISLVSEDPGYEYQESFFANCDRKGWEILIQTEAEFLYSYETLLSIPRNFTLSVQILRDGVWEHARDFLLSFSCPWPPPEECLSDCGGGVEEPPPQEQPVDGDEEWSATGEKA